MKGTNTLIGGPDNLLGEVNEIEMLTKKFEISLRTSFCCGNPFNYITIQRVNTECEHLKARVKKILEQPIIATAKKFKVQQVAESALFYINKFEDAKSIGIVLDGDILKKLAETKK